MYIMYSCCHGYAPFVFICSKIHLHGTFSREDGHPLIWGRFLSTMLTSLPPVLSSLKPAFYSTNLCDWLLRCPTVNLSFSVIGCCDAPQWTFPSGAAWRLFPKTYSSLHVPSCMMFIVPVRGRISYIE